MIDKTLLYYNHGTENDFICKNRKPTMYISLFTSVISGGIWFFMVNLTG